MISGMGILYGPRDAACVLMGRGHRVARRWISKGDHLEFWWYLDGRRVALFELEDRAEDYERLRYRHTPRGTTRL